MIIEKSILTDKLKNLKPAIPKKSDWPALLGVLIEGNTMTAYNMEIGIRATIETDNQESFILPLSAIDLIPKLPDGPIEITIDGTNITIKASGSKSKHVTMPAADYPKLPTIETAEAKEIEGPELAEALSKVLYAVATEASRPAITGIFFQHEDDTLNLVGCDGHRISWAKVDYTEAAGFIVPREAIQKLLAIGLDNQVIIKHDNKLASFITDEYTLITRLIEGQYLDYKKVFRETDKNITVNRRALLESIDRCMISVKDAKNTVTLVINEQITVKGKSPAAEYTESIDLLKNLKEPLEIAFNARYLIECLKSFDTTNINFGMTAENAPMVIDADTNTRAILLPIRTV